MSGKEKDEDLKKNAETTPSSEIEEIDEEGTEVIPPEILDQLPPHARESIRETFGIISRPMSNPIASKITSDHISSVIENDERESVRKNNQKTTGRFFTLVYVLIGVVVFFILANMFAKSDPALFKEILKILGTFVAGIGAGWGFTTAASKRNQS